MTNKNPWTTSLLPVLTAIACGASSIAWAQTNNYPSSQPGMPPFPEQGSQFQPPPPPPPNFASSQQPGGPFAPPPAWMNYPDGRGEPFIPAFPGSGGGDLGGGGGFDGAFGSSGSGGGLGSGSASKGIVFQNVEFKIVPAVGSEGDCPVFVQISDEQLKDDKGKVQNLFAGEAALRWLAGTFSVQSRGNELTKWSASLDERYNGCAATGMISKRDGWTVLAKDAYLFLKFQGGRIELTLDVSRLPGKPVIKSAGISQSGGPVWRWSKEQTLAR